MSELMPQLLAGAAQVDITPSLGTHLSGSVGEHRPAKDIWDPLFAKAAVLESAGRRICLLALDTTIVTADYTRRVRDGAAALGLAPDDVMVHATQTHSAPSLGHFMVDPDFPPVPDEFEWVRGAEASYGDWAANRAVECIRLAIEALEPVEIGAGSAIEGRWAFNRRAVTRDGGILMPPPVWMGGDVGPTDIRYIEGPMDPELGVLCLRRADHSIAALIANYTCHPVHVFPRPCVSADWPGALADGLRDAYGDPCVPIVTNGACGNINPWPPFDPDYVEDHRAMGAALATRARAAVDSVEFAADAVIDARIRRVPLPLRELSDDELAWAEGILEANPTPTWVDEERIRIDAEWMAAASIFSVHLARQRGPELEYEIQALRIGDAAFVGLPGEPFVEAGLKIKLDSPTHPTYIVHCTSEYVGYIPTREALQRGGHEVNTRYWAKLKPEALDIVTDGATDLLREIFA